MAETQMTTASMHLGDDANRIRTDYGNTPGGRHYSLLIIGPLVMYTHDASPETLRRVASHFEELAAWRERHDAAEGVAS